MGDSMMNKLYLNKAVSESGYYRIKILNLASSSLPLKAHLYFTCVDILPAYLAVYHVSTVPVVSQREFQIPWNWSYR